MTKLTIKRCFVITAFFMVAVGFMPVAGQERSVDDLSEDELFDLSLEDLMDIQVVSASKKEESLFDAPLSATVISRGEIEKSGATSIMEALRLAPGVIVREQNNGSYDIHIRGLDNVPPYTYFSASTSVTTLVMIDS